MPHQPSPEGFLSVTEVLSYGLPKVSFSKAGAPWFFLERWRGNVGNKEADRKSKEGKNRGLEIHDQIEKKFKGEDVSSIIVDAFWHNFVELYEVKPVALEQTMQDPDLKLQGTYDAVIQTTQGEYVADWKTSNQLDLIGGPLQLAMYDHLRKGTGKGVLVRMDKSDYAIEVKWFENLKAYEPIWRAALTVARYNRFGLESK